MPPPVVDFSAILSRIEDLRASVATSKQLDALSDSVKAAERRAIEQGDDFKAAVKGFTTKLADLGEALEKGLKKVREDLTAELEEIDVGGGEESGEAVEKVIKEQVGELKKALTFLVGDDPETIGAVRSKIRTWIGAGGKAAKKALEDVE